MCLAEASYLVCLDLRKSNICSFKYDLRIYGLVLLVPLVLRYFWYFWYWFYGTYGRDIQPLKRCVDDAKLILRGGHNFLDSFKAEKIHF
jgi:hypothetical protein